MVSKLHFNNVDGIVYFLGNKNLKEQTFAAVVAENNKLLKSLNSGFVLLWLVGHLNF